MRYDWPSDQHLRWNYSHQHCRKEKWATILTSNSSLSEDTKEVFEEAECKPSTYTTISGNIVDTFAFHAALIGIAILIGQIIVKLFNRFITV